jgi:hypothetical protein
LAKQPTQNSIIFLAALGVYLGLLVAGASPGVISQQAALTRSFDISDEIEVTDDLDKDPEAADANVETASERSLSYSFSGFFSSISVPVSRPALPELNDLTAVPTLNEQAPRAIGIPLTAKISVSNLARANI